MNSNWVIIVRYGEIGIKGERTRNRMENLLIRNIIDVLKRSRCRLDLKINKSRGRIYLTGFKSEEESVEYLNNISHVMGIVSLSPAFMTNFNTLEDLCNKAFEFFVDRIRGNSFAIRVRRIGSHDFTSIDVARLVGEKIVKKTNLRVDLTYPDYTACIEIRNNIVYFYDKIVNGPGGLPIGSEGRVLVLFSGGIDSPVATWFIMRRGCEADLLLFNIAGSKQVEMVKKIAYVLMSNWCFGYRPKMYIIDLKPLIARLLSSIPENYIVIVMRRLMMRIASRLADKINAKAVVTGENLGQVASQTLDNLVIIDSASTKTVLRPLIGFDKNDIIEYAKMIGTYEYSSKLPEYCLIGTRRVNPHAILERVLEYESRINISDRDVEELIDKAEVYDILESESVRT
ncbi:MAG: tRNA uracil 4-sulfurtransferase ThiI [Desulfurococcaceae archaeon]